MEEKQDLYTITENGLDVFYYRVQQYSPNQNTQFRTYDGYLKAFRVRQGNAVWKIENKEYPVQKGDILILNNSERRQLNLQNSHEPFVIEYAQFLPYFLYPYQYAALPFFFRESSFNHLITPSDESYEELYRLFDMLTLCAQREFAFKREYVYALLLQSLTLFAQKLPQTALSPKRLEGHLTLYQKICNITEYISHHPNEDLSQACICKRFSLSKYYFSHLFKAYNGVNFPTYVKTVRIHHAVQLLKQGKKNVIDVAFACGFGSLSSFYAAFKEVLGESPKKYLSETYSAK